MERFIDTNELGLAVVYAVQGFLLLFFVISPIGGAFIAGKIRRRSTSVIIMACLAIIFNVLFVGLTYLLQDRDTLPEQSALLVGLAAAIIITAILGGLTFWLYHDEQSAIEQERHNIAFDNAGSDFSFQQRRQKRLKKRAKRR